MSVCKGCGAPIDWIRTTEGRNMPVDPEPVFIIEGSGTDRFITDEGAVILGRMARPDEESAALPVSRMFGWVSNTIVLTFWGKLDKRLNRRLIDNICDTMNIWLNGLTAEEKILGGRVEFREDENPDTSLMAGKATFHVFLTPCSPAKHLHFILEYDIDYLSALFE